YKDFDNLHYYLKDIDNNGIPELFIGFKYSKNDSWDSKGLLGMYTYKDGNILYYFDSYGDRGRFYLLNTDEIFVGEFGGMYSHNFTTYTFSNFELTANDVITIGLSEDMPYEEFRNEWKHNGEEVAPSYANSLLEEKASQIADIDFKPISEFSGETAEQKSGITVLLNGDEMAFDVEPYIENGVTMVPMRAIFEALGAEVSFNSETKSITAVKGSKTIILTVASTSAYINGELVTMQSPAVINGGYTMVPLRFVSENLDADVVW
ncbi:MAG: copper amine oxidase N-terminal domain-containing protein, partial [Clostridiales bacterium]|nr:copper amine oxidase N-terminal domain-containing protein [Clostridiales bacterium]